MKIIDLKINCKRQERMQKSDFLTKKVKKKRKKVKMLNIECYNLRNGDEK